MLRLENVATPFTAATLVVPASVPPPGFAPIATAMVPVNPDTTAFDASNADTRTVPSDAPVCALPGCELKIRCVALGGGGGGGGGAVTLNALLVAPVSPLEAAVRV